MRKMARLPFFFRDRPNELIPMFEESVFSYLRKKQPEIICSQVVKICGIGESQVAADIQDMIETQTNPTLAPYAKTGEVHLRITAKVRMRNPAEADQTCSKGTSKAIRQKCICPGCGQNAGRICCGSAEGERINSVSCRILYRWLPLLPAL